MQIGLGMKADTLIRIPAWTLLTADSFNRLLPDKAAAVPEAIRVGAEGGAGLSELAEVPLLATTRLLVARAATDEGLKLTARGNLSRADVRVLFDALSWPDYDKAMILAVNKVLNEPDVWPVEITRVLAKEAKLLRVRKGRVRATKSAVALMDTANALSSLRLLFETLFWRINLGYLDRVPVGVWPQDHVGVVIWCLSTAADHWTSVGDLMDVCTVPDAQFAENEFDYRTYAMENRILRPLTWFGLMERKPVGKRKDLSIIEPRLYRKSALFDRLLTFDVTLRDTVASLH